MVEEFKNFYYQYLDYIYKSTEGDISVPFFPYRNIDKGDFGKIHGAVEYLFEKQLITKTYRIIENISTADIKVYFNTGSKNSNIRMILPYVGEESLLSIYQDAISITLLGIETLQNIKEQSDKSMENYLMTNSLNIHNSHVQIMQNSQNSSQHMEINEISCKEISVIINEIENKWTELHLDVPENQSVKADIETIKAQLSSKSPRKGIIEECWPSVRDFAIQAGAALFSQAAWMYLTGGVK